MKNYILEHNNIETIKNTIKEFNSYMKINKNEFLKNYFKLSFFKECFILNCYVTDIYNNYYPQKIVEKCFKENENAILEKIIVSIKDMEKVFNVINKNKNVDIFINNNNINFKQGNININIKYISEDDYPEIKLFNHNSLLLNLKNNDKFYLEYMYNVIKKDNNKNLSLNYFYFDIDNSYNCNIVATDGYRLPILRKTTLREKEISFMINKEIFSNFLKYNQKHDKDIVSVNSVLSYDKNDKTEHFSLFHDRYDNNKNIFSSVYIENRENYYSYPNYKIIHDKTIKYPYRVSIFSDDEIIKEFENVVKFIVKNTDSNTSILKFNLCQLYEIKVESENLINDIRISYVFEKVQNGIFSDSQEIKHVCFNPIFFIEYMKKFKHVFMLFQEKEKMVKFITDDEFCCYHMPLVI